MVIECQHLACAANTVTVSALRGQDTDVLVWLDTRENIAMRVSKFPNYSLIFRLDSGGLLNSYKNGLRKLK